MARATQHVYLHALCAPLSLASCKVCTYASPPWPVYVQPLSSLAGQRSRRGGSCMPPRYAASAASQPARAVALAQPRAPPSRARVFVYMPVRMRRVRRSLARRGSGCGGALLVLVLVVLALAIAHFLLLLTASAILSTPALHNSTHGERRARPCGWRPLPTGLYIHFYHHPRLLARPLHFPCPRHIDAVSGVAIGVEQS